MAKLMVEKLRHRVTRKVILSKIGSTEFSESMCPVSVMLVFCTWDKPSVFKPLYPENRIWNYRCCGEDMTEFAAPDAFSYGTYKSNTRYNSSARTFTELCMEKAAMFTKLSLLTPSQEAVIQTLVWMTRLNQHRSNKTGSGGTWTPFL